MIIHQHDSNRFHRTPSFYPVRMSFDSETNNHRDPVQVLGNVSIEACSSKSVQKVIRVERVVPQEQSEDRKGYALENYAGTMAVVT